MWGKKAKKNAGKNLLREQRSAPSNTTRGVVQKKIKGPVGGGGRPGWLQLNFVYDDEEK